MQASGVKNASSGLSCMWAISDMPENGSKPRHYTSLSENRRDYCGRNISASSSRKFRQIEQLFTSSDEKI